MRRVFAVSLLASSFALAGVAPAASPAPARTPAPAAARATATPRSTASPSPAPATQKLPLVVVYPFDFSTDLRPDTGTKAAQLYVAEMNAAGGVDALQAPTKIKRPDYLSYARSLNAAYYVSGYMTPLGGGVSLVEQVVDTQSGTIILGATAQIQSFEDAASQAVNIRDGIVQREQGRAQAFAQTSAESTPAPLPSNQANIGGGIANLFKHHGRETPHPAAAVIKPSKGVFVMRVAGAADAGQLSQATNALYLALNERYNAHLTGNAGDASKQASAICGSARDNTVAGGTLSSESVRRGIFRRARYTFVFSMYTCFGAKLAQTSGQGDSIGAAITQAVSAYAADHPDNA